jgi:predicted alpha/beta hydrolase family esterase
MPTEPAPVPITVSASAFTAILIGLVSRVLVFVGGILVAHGFATEDMVNQAIDPLAQQIGGALITAGAAWWGAWYAKHRQSKLVTMATKLPNSVAVVK